MPWELGYLLTPWRWLGEWGLVHLYTETDRERREWLVGTGLVGILVNMGATLREPCGERYAILRIGRFQWSWSRQQGCERFAFDGFKNWGKA